MKTIVSIVFMMGLSLGIGAEPIKPCIPTAKPIPTVINQPIWIYPNRDNPNWHIVPTNSSPPRTSSSVPSRGG